MPFTYTHPRPLVTVDAVVFRRRGRALDLLVVRRGAPPFEGELALPGGFVEMDEDLPDAAARELQEETGLTGISLVQVGAFGAPGRDPRGRTISVAFAGWIEDEGQGVRGGDDAAEALWVDAREPPPLAFDHERILTAALFQMGEGVKKTS